MSSITNQDKHSTRSNSFLGCLGVSFPTFADFAPFASLARNSPVCLLDWTRVSSVVALFKNPFPIHSVVEWRVVLRDAAGTIV